MQNNNRDNRVTKTINYFYLREEVHIESKQDQSMSHFTRLSIKGLSLNLN